MSEYIKRADAIQAVKDCSYSLDEDELIEVNGFSAIDSINNLPTVDVVEVIRCKDCRHYVNSEHYGMMCEILVHAEQGDNFYCGYGQKKLEQEKWDV